MSELELELKECVDNSDQLGVEAMESLSKKDENGGAVCDWKAAIILNEEEHIQQLKGKVNCCYNYPPVLNEVDGEERKDFSQIESQLEIDCLTEVACVSKYEEPTQTEETKGGPIQLCPQDGDLNAPQFRGTGSIVLREIVEGHSMDQATQEVILSISNNFTKGSVALEKDQEQVKLLEEQHKCLSCSKEFKHKSLLRIHLNAAHKLGPLHHCPICERPYYGRKAPRRHIWTHYSEEDKKEALERGEKVPSCFEKGFKCAQCPSAYTTNSELLKHQKQVHEEVVLRHVCGECGKSVKNLAGHMRQSHPKEEDFRFVCTTCEAKFINSARLKQHKLSRHGEGKKVKCERCGKQFKTRRELNVHVNSAHLKVKPYKCSHCEMAFTRKMSWTRHIQAHEGKEQQQGVTKKRRLTSEK